MSLLKGYAINKNTAYEVLRDCPQSFVDAWKDFCESDEGRDIAQRIESYLTEKSCFGGGSKFGAFVTGELSGDPLYAGLLGACNLLGAVPEESSRRLLHNSHRNRPDFSEPFRTFPNRTEPDF